MGCDWSVRNGAELNGFVYSFYLLVTKLVNPEVVGSNPTLVNFILFIKCYVASQFPLVV